MKEWIVVTVLLAFAAGCQTSTPALQESGDVASLNGSTHVLKVDKRYKHPRMGESHNKPDDSHYTKDTQGISYPIEFSADGRAVNVATDIADKVIEGSLVSDVQGVKTYSLKAFGGGRLVVRAVDGYHEAELTIYGSGEPVIMSVRGRLVENGLSNNHIDGDS